MSKSENELARFKKSLILHSSRYNLYSDETLIKGSTSKHNQAVKAIGKLEDMVIADSLSYSDLLLELLYDSNPKVVLCTAFICLNANIYTDKAIEKLVYIANNTSGISAICDLDIRGSITKFRKRILDSKPRNEVDELAKIMNPSEKYKDTELLEMILGFQNLDMCGHDERTALIHACIFNRLELAQKLVELGADVNINDYSQKTALHCATIVGNRDIVSLLLNHHANVNAQDKRGFTALDFAKANAGNLPQDELTKMIELLMLYGAKTKNEILSGCL